MLKLKKMGRVGLVGLVGLLLGAVSAQASWWNLLNEDFGSGSTDHWHYTGVSNVTDQALFRIDTDSGVVDSEWDQSNYFVGEGDPYHIENSVLFRSLPRILRDTDTFRIGATLRLAGGSISDTSEFWQLANLGLYNLAEMGPDRALADDWSTNTNLIRNGSDFIEFNYWINNAATVWGDFGPNIGAVVGGHVANEFDMLYTTGDWGDTGFFHNTDMGLNHYLPTDADLFIELTYHGATTGVLARRVYTAVYTDAAHSTLLEVNGVPMTYWTQPVPTANHFTLTEAAFFNYVSLNYGGANGAGAGTWDDLYVDMAVGEGGLVDVAAGHPATVLTWAAEPGVDYAVLVSTNLVSGVWATQQVVTATGSFISAASPVGAATATWRIERVEDP